MKTVLRLIFLVCLVVTSGALAQGSYTASRSGLDAVDVDIMFIGAHPDDDGGVMGTFARYLRDGGYTGTVVTLTGGEGGSNATGPESGRALGLIREQEERRALSMVGVDSPHWLGLSDFYFTLSAEETLKMWGGDAFVCDVVRLVRLRRPEIILTMWPGPGTHGNHQEAARAATVAFEKAGDSSFCSEQITSEYLEPFTPLKLYYYPDDAEATTIEVPTDTMSRSADMTYADLRALAQREYRTQGWDQFRTIPVEDPGPERFMLVRSRVPVRAQESSLLEGALEPVGGSPAGIRLEVLPESYEAGRGVALPVRVALTNDTDAPLENLDLSLQAPDGWQVDATGETSFATLEPGASAEANFTVTAGEGVETSGATALSTNYSATWDGRTVEGGNNGYVRAVAPVQVAFKPLYDVAGYLAYAQETQTEQVIPTLPTRLPLLIGQDNPVTVTVTNRSDAAASGSLSFDLPTGVTASGATDFEVAAGESKDLTVTLQVSDAALPETRHSVTEPLTVSANIDGATSSDEANLYALPTLAVSRVASAPTIDGNLSDWQDAAGGSLSSLDTWQGKTEGDEDSSGTFNLGYDDENLYVGLNVTDQTVVCNIAPDNVRGFHRSDAVFVSVDPSGTSEDTSTVFQLGLFPCTTDGFSAVAARDADANQGDAAATAPNTRFASQQTENGYALEVAIPWSEMPGSMTPTDGANLRLNLTVFDGDSADAEPGANIRESSISWSAFDLGGKQFLPFLWPEVTLQ